jgi:hypothetical protein
LKIIAFPKHRAPSAQVAWAWLQAWEQAAGCLTMQKENRLNHMKSYINYVHVNAVVVCPWGAGGVPPPGSSSMETKERHRRHGTATLICVTSIAPLPYVQCQ